MGEAHIVEQSMTTDSVSHHEKTFNSDEIIYLSVRGMFPNFNRHEGVTNDSKRNDCGP